MSVRYSTNMMGPWSLHWYRQRGLTKNYSKIVTREDSILLKFYRIGELVHREEITEYWSGGRIDIRISDFDEYPYHTEIALPVMKGTDYNRFSDWLKTFETDDVWTLDQLVEMYERTNPKITWDNYLT